MNGVNPTSSAVIADLQLATASPDETSAGALGQNDFLRLMTTQLQAQDPMEPMKTEEIFSQLAQFGTVSGIANLQSSFENLAASLQSMQALQASGLVGQQVLVASDRAQLSEANAIEGQVQTPANGTDVTLSVFDASGQLVDSQILPVTGDRTEFRWNGDLADGTKAPPGYYTLSAHLNSSGGDQSLETRVKANVDSVTLNSASGGFTLNLDGLGSVASQDVLEISNDAAAAPAPG